MLLLHSLSRSSCSQWPSWSCVRLLASLQHVVVSAEAVKAAAQHGQGLVRLPADMQQTLEGYLSDAGLSGKVSKQQALALTDKLKALSRSTAVGGLQPYRSHDGAAGAAPAHWQKAQGDAAMTAEQVQEQRELDKQMEQLAASLGPDELARYKATRAAAAAAAKLPLAHTKGGRLKSSTLRAIEEHLDQHGLLGLPHEAVRAAYGLPPSSSIMSDSRGEAIKGATPKYNQTQALAYAISRLPSCFAACQRIFRELAVRLPDIEPKTMLDFGAGPGTAIWAAQEVWPSGVSRVTAVEPSPAMSQLGRRLEAARRFSHPHAPLVRWRPDMPPEARSTRKKQQQQTYDLVVASYVLGELPTPQERAALIRQLWGVTSNMLVLIEPGTPAGFANILEARTGILEYEGRRVEKLQSRLTDADTTSSSSSSTSNSSSMDAAVQAKLSSRWFGAHVVAPCPHDGPCPLAVPGSRSWCHFGTRFQRPGFMQQAKAPAGARVNAADHQDERYSYVVLRRGMRPADAPQVDIRRSFVAKQSSSMAATAPPAAARDTQSTGERRLFDMSSAVYPEGSSQEQPPQQLQQQQQASSAGTEAAAEADNSLSSSVAASNRPLFSSDELQLLSSLLPGPSGQVEATSLQQQQPTGGVEFEQGAALPGHKKLGPYGPGLINRLIALEDAGVNWSVSGSPSPEALSHAFQQDNNSGSSSVSVGATAALPSQVQLAAPVPTQAEADAVHNSESDTDSKSYDMGSEAMEGQSGAVDAWQGADADGTDGLLEAASSSSGWSRIVRPPRKRGGHIILDVCTRLQPDGNMQPSSAAIVRHVVARSDATKWLGSAGYELARSARWGDLWPAAYHRNDKQHIVSPIRDM